MLASHNSISYLPPVNLVGKLLRPWSQCQSATIAEQIRYGVKYFDLRVFYKGTDLHFCHGITDYGLVKNHLEVFEQLNKAGATVRFSMDVRKTPDNPDKLKRWLFWDIESVLKQHYPNITFDSIKFFWEPWSTDYGNQRFPVTEKHWSVVDKKWYEWIMPLKQFANKYRLQWLLQNYYDELHSQTEVLMIDYVKG